MPSKLLDSDCEYAQTPNTGDKRAKTSLVVLHYTASDDYHASVQWFLEKRAKASAHLVIGASGETCQLADLDVETRHCGKSSYWEDRAGCDSFSVGIELVNLGPLLRKPDGPYVSVAGSRVVQEDRAYEGKHGTNRRCAYEYWHTYPEPQLARLREVIGLLRERYPGVCVVGHSDVSPGRKLDPGPALPARFSAESERPHSPSVASIPR